MAAELLLLKTTQDGAPAMGHFRLARPTTDDGRKWLDHYRSDSGAQVSATRMPDESLGPAAALMPAAKRQLRAELLARRATRDPETRNRLGLRLAATARRRPQLATARLVCAYVGVGTEPATLPLLDGLRSVGVAVLLPVLAADRALDWAPYAGAAGLAPGRYGLLQPAGAPLGPNAPAEADVLLVPALAVDLRGARLGRGGGYYDRLLARLAVADVARGQVWAVVYDEEVLEAVPTEPHDVPVHAALTPSRLRQLWVK